jgi:uncharacterized protein YdhG (YjbR/CyaY superfamily)
MSTKTEITSYIDSCPPQSQEQLKNLRNFILQEFPQLEEVISYKMPAYKFNRILIYFAGYKNHIGFYPTSSGIKNFENEIQRYKYSKGAIQFSINEELPYKLIKKIILFRMKENEQKMLAKKNI